MWYIYWQLPEVKIHLMILFPLRELRFAEVVFHNVREYIRKDDKSKTRVNKNLGYDI